MASVVDRPDRHIVKHRLQQRLNFLGAMLIAKSGKDEPFVDHGLDFYAVHELAPARSGRAASEVNEQG